MLRRAQLFGFTLLIILACVAASENLPTSLTLISAPTELPCGAPVVVGVSVLTDTSPAPGLPGSLAVLQVWPKSVTRSLTSTVQVARVSEKNELWWNFTLSDLSGPLNAIVRLAANPGWAVSELPFFFSIAETPVDVGLSSDLPRSAAAGGALSPQFKFTNIPANSYGTMQVNLNGKRVCMKNIFDVHAAGTSSLDCPFVAPLSPGAYSVEMIVDGTGGKCCHLSGRLTQELLVVDLADLQSNMTQLAAAVADLRSRSPHFVSVGLSVPVMFSCPAEHRPLSSGSQHMCNINATVVLDRVLLQQPEDLSARIRYDVATGVLSISEAGSYRLDASVHLVELEQAPVSLYPPFCSAFRFRSPALPTFLLSTFSSSSSPVRLNPQNPIVNADGSAVRGSCSGDVFEYWDTALHRWRNTYVGSDGYAHPLPRMFSLDNVNQLRFNPGASSIELLTILDGKLCRLLLTCNSQSTDIQFAIGVQDVALASRPYTPDDCSRGPLAPTVVGTASSLLGWVRVGTAEIIGELNLLQPTVIHGRVLSTTAAPSTLPLSTFVALTDEDVASKPYELQLVLFSAQTRHPAVMLAKTSVISAMLLR